MARLRTFSAPHKNRQLSRVQETRYPSTGRVYFMSVLGTSRHCRFRTIAAMRSTAAPGARDAMFRAKTTPPWATGPAWAALLIVTAKIGTAIPLDLTRRESKDNQNARSQSSSDGCVHIYAAGL